jgi:hypothetical protein
MQRADDGATVPGRRFKVQDSSSLLAIAVGKLSKMLHLEFLPVPVEFQKRKKNLKFRILNGWYSQTVEIQILKGTIFDLDLQNSAIDSEKRG